MPSEGVTTCRGRREGDVMLAPLARKVNSCLRPLYTQGRNVVIGQGQHRLWTPSGPPQFTYT